MSKAVSFGVMHLAVAFAVTWSLTGRLAVGGAVALVEPLVNTLAYVIHEKVWAQRVSTHETSAQPFHC